MGRMNSDEFQFECGSVIKALTATFGPNDKMSLLGKVYTRDQLVAIFRNALDLDLAADHAERLWHISLKQAGDAARELRPVRNALKQQLQAQWGKTSPRLVPFSFLGKEAKKPSPPTVVAAVVARRATREARHTMGPKQKKRIKG
jgi:hypothetical protein